jgi:hypothetical protein
MANTYFYNYLKTGTVSTGAIAFWTFYNYYSEATGNVAITTQTFDWGPNALTSTYWLQSVQTNIRSIWGGYYRTGTIATGSVVAGASGTTLFGGGIWFEGGNNPTLRMDMPSSTAFTAIDAGKPFSIVVWVGLGAPTASNSSYALVGKWNGSGSAAVTAGGWVLMAKSGTGNASMYDVPVFYFTASAPSSGFLAYTASNTGSPVLNWWDSIQYRLHCIGFTYDGSATISSALFYRDGYLWSSGGWNQVCNSANFSTSSSCATSLTCTIGASQGTTITGSGYYGPVFMWNRVLSASEMRYMADPQLVDTLLYVSGSSTQIGTQDASGTSVPVMTPSHPRIIDYVSSSAGGGGDPRESKLNPGTN